MVRQRGWHGIKNMLRTVSSKESTDQETKKDSTYQTVYNLQVIDEHEYFANNVLVHNCDSWALAEWAYARWSENKVSIATVTVSQDKERNVVRDKKGRVQDYWPE